MVQGIGFHWRIYLLKASLIVSLLTIVAMTQVAIAKKLTEAEIWQVERPIDAFDTVFLEQMTWMEVRDAIKTGKTTVIIPTGGVEQKGPYSAIGRHNFSLQITTEMIARKLGNAVVAPVVAFVPQGSIEPKSKHMLYPGTISVREEIFVELLIDIANSMKAHGFKNIVLLGDNGGNRSGLATAEQRLAKAWQGSNSKIHYIEEFYDNPRWKKWMKARGIVEVSEGYHDGYRSSSVMMLYDPMAARMPQRIEKGLFHINGISLLPVDKTIKFAKEFVNYRTDVTVEAIEQALADDQQSAIN